jgi:hypothetical protein
VLEPASDRSAPTICLILVSLAAAVPVAAGQNAPPSTPEDKPPQQGEARPTGLPSPVRWPFNFDAG